MKTDGEFLLISEENRIIQLNLDGSIHNSFEPVSSIDMVNWFDVAADNRILVSGTGFGDSLAMLSADGSVIWSQNEAEYRGVAFVNDGYFLASPDLMAIAQIGRYSMEGELLSTCLLYTSPSPRDKRQSRMPSSA